MQISISLDVQVAIHVHFQKLYTAKDIDNVRLSVCLSVRQSVCYQRVSMFYIVASKV